MASASSTWLRPASRTRCSSAATRTATVRRNNDLLFIPSNLILCPAASNAAPNATAPCRTNTATQTPLDKTLFTNFLTSVGYEPGRVKSPERNSLDQPWTRRLDFHYEIGLPQMFGTRVSIQADVLNLLNMFDKDAGVQRFVVNNTYMPVTYSGQDPTTGLPGLPRDGRGTPDPGQPVLDRQPRVALAGSPRTPRHVLIFPQTW